MSPRNVLLASLLSAVSASGVDPALASTPERASTDEAGEASVCFYVSSYHVGMAWADSISASVKSELDGRCRVESFHMDTKRRRDPVQMAAAGDAAYARMLELQPDVVIVSDDNAMRYFVEPRLLGTDTPVVFTGINWTIEEYDLPAPNVTGMIEVAPMKPLLRLGGELSGGGTRVLHFAADTVTSRKSAERLRRIAAELGMSIDSVLVDSVVAWHNAWRRVQDEHDFIVLDDVGAFGSWDEASMRRFTLDNTRVPVLASTEHTLAYASVGLTHVSAELGEWAGASAAAILDGLSPAEIPVVTNRRWDAWINEPMVERLGLDVDEAFARTAKRVR